MPGGVVSSRGGLPDSLAVHGDLVYVANSGVGHSNYTGFRLGFGGHLFHLPGSTVTLASGAAPGDVLFNGTGTKLVGTEVGPSVIDGFTVGFGGRLTAAPGSPFPAQGLGPFGSEFRPTNPDQLFVSNAHNTATDRGTVSAFKDHRNGRFDRASPATFSGSRSLCRTDGELTRPGAGHSWLVMFSGRGGGGEQGAGDEPGCVVSVDAADSDILCRGVHEAAGGGDQPVPWQAAAEESGRRRRRARPGACPLNDSGRAACPVSAGTGCPSTPPCSTPGWVKAAGITQPHWHHNTLL